MPNYCYRCERCSHAYEEFRPITAEHPEKCPNCDEPLGSSFHQDYTQCRALGVVKNITTIGQLAEANAKRMGKELVSIKSREGKKTPNSDWKGPVPDGGVVQEQGPGEKPWWRENEKPLDVAKLNTAQKIEKYINTGEGA